MIPGIAFLDLKYIVTNATTVKALTNKLANTYQPNNVGATEAEAKKHVAAYPHVHVTSSEKGMGIDELRAAVLSDAGV